MPTRRSTWILPPAAALLVLWAAVACAADGPKRLCEVPQSLKRPAGAPQAGDVVMRTLSLHPRGKSDPHDTMEAVRQFHVTRLEWSYVTNKDFIARLKASGRTFGGAASAPSYIPKKGDRDWYDNVVIRDAAGTPIIAPWKRTWKRTLWGCVNNPEYERGYLEYLRGYIDAGAEVMQRDEPGANYNATQWGGCFCPHCMDAFRKYLAQNTTDDERQELGIGPLASFDYRQYVNEHGAPVGDRFRQWKGGRVKELFVQFQTEATIAFHQRTRAAIDRYAGRHVPFSCNNGARRFTPIEFGFDWFFGELSYRHALPGNLLAVFREALSHGRVQVLTMPKKGDFDDLDGWQLRTRRTIAMGYASGGLCMVPWDVYMPKDAPRYFGAPEQYADLFGFVRACREYLDGYEEAAVAGGPDEETRYGATPPIALDARGGQVWAVGRARPQEPDASVVVHLVSWSDASGPFAVKLHTPNFFGPGRLAAELFVPPEYNEAAHRKAEESGDYSALRCSLKPASKVDGEWTVFEIPPLSPWGILVVKAED